MPKSVHPQIEKALAALAKANLPALHTLTAPQARAQMEAMTAARGGEPTAVAHTLDRKIPGPAGEIPVRIYWPAEGGTRGALVYYHGGGFVKGSPQSSDTTGWGLAMDSRAVCVSVDYRLAPEHKYPTPFHDCYGPLAHIAANGPEYGVDAGRLAVAGDSAGGNLAAAVALKARDTGGPALRAQALIYPCLTDDLSAPSFAYNANPPGLSTQSMGNYWNWYLGEDMVSEDPYATPLKALNLANLPPAMILTAEYDPLYCDGVEYAARLRAAGVPVHYHCGHRLIHGFMRARLKGQRSAAAFAAMTGFLRERFRV